MFNESVQGFKLFLNEYLFVFLLTYTYIQVDLPSDNLWVSGVMTQGFGNENINMWVREFYVGYQVGVDTFNPVLNYEGATHVSKQQQQMNVKF